MIPAISALRSSSRISARASPSSESGRDSPWDTGHERELRVRAESNLSHWRSKARWAEKMLYETRAALDDTQDVRGPIHHQHSDIYRQGVVLREKLRRWARSNWPQLCTIALVGDDDEEDLNEQLLETPWFRRRIKAILEKDRQECANLLATHAYRPEKFFLAKMLLKVSGRAMGWMQSLFKFDHSQVDAAGKRLRIRESMHPDSNVPAPPIWPIKAIGALMDAEVRSPDAMAPERINEQSEDRRAAVVRDIHGVVVDLIEKAAARVCGGMASDGSEANPHWICVTMDGAGLTHEDNGVRFALFPGSVKGMNQSTNCLRTIVFYRAAGAAEDYDTLWARAAHARVELAKIWRAGGVVGSDGKFVHVKLMLTADKAGFCHMTGRRNQNYDNFGVFCDCKDCAIYNFSYNPFTHYGRVTYEVRVGRAHAPLWEACGECEPHDWTVHCDVCKQVRASAHPRPATRRADPPCHCCIADVLKEGDRGRVRTS